MSRTVNKYGRSAMAVEAVELYVHGNGATGTVDKRTWRRLIPRSLR